MTWMRIIGAGVGAVLLAGCSSEPQEQSPVREMLSQMIAARQAARDAADGATLPPPAEPTRALFEGLDKEVAFISITGLGGKALFTNVQDNNGVKTYFSANKQSVSFRDGVLVATRGFGWDLIVKDQGDGMSKNYKYYTSENGISQINVTCEVTEKHEEIEIVEITYQTTLSEEICRGSAAAFKNRIWRDADGKAWKVQQWVGPQLGHAVVEFLN